MTIEIGAFIVLVVFIATSLTSIGLKRRQDVLYGPYIEGRRQGRRPLGAVTAPLSQVIRGLRPSARQLSWRLRSVGFLVSAIVG